jgi:hypothetical protein
MNGKTCSRRHALNGRQHMSTDQHLCQKRFLQIFVRVGHSPKATTRPGFLLVRQLGSRFFPDHGHPRP